MRSQLRARRAARRYRGESADARRRERRRRLLEAGFELFGARGFETTHIRSVCRRARVAPRHFYESFGSKEELLQAVLEEVVRRTRREALEALAGAPDDPRARLEAGLRAFAHAFLDDPRAIRVALVEAVGRSAALESQRRRYVREFASLIADQAEAFAREGRIGLPTAAERVGLAMTGMVSELLIEWTTQVERPSADELTEELMAIFDVVLRGAEPCGAEARAAETALPGAPPAPRRPV